MIPNSTDEMDQLKVAATEALTDGMVERLATTGGNAMEVLDTLNDEATRDAVLTVINDLKVLNQIGGVRALVDMARVALGAQNAMTDGMVERFAETAGNSLEVVDALNDEGSRLALLQVIEDLKVLNDIGGVRALVDMARVILGAQNAMTDGMVERFAETAGNSLEVVDALNDEGARAAVLQVIDDLKVLNDIGGVRALVDIARVVLGAQNAMTDGMVERFAETAGNALELADWVNNADTRDAIHFAMDELTKLHKAGGLKTAFDTMHLLNAMNNAMTGSMIERLTGFAEHMMNNLATEDVADLAHATREAMHEAKEEVLAQPAKGGIWEAYKIVSQPETIQTLQYLISVGQKLQRKS